MATLPAIINGVAIDLAPSAIGINLDQRLVDALELSIRQDVASGYPLKSLWISSANDSHAAPSRHAIGKGIDISRVNGKYIFGGYNGDAALTAIVNAMQDAFEKYPHRRENFGPHLKLKLGNAFSIGGHDDHIHFSVN